MVGHSRCCACIYCRIRVFCTAYSVAVQNEQKSFDGFNLELLELSEKWKLRTMTTSFSITQHSIIENAVKTENEVKTEHKVKRLNTIRCKPIGLSHSVKKTRS